MRLLANEYFPGAAVTALRNAGHDVAWVQDDSPGIADRQVLARAVAEARILVTFDKDFGELAFRHGLPAGCGIILFRIAPDSADHVADTAVRILAARNDWPGHFSVVDEIRVRMTPPPHTGVNGSPGGTSS